MSSKGTLEASCLVRNEAFNETLKRFSQYTRKSFGDLLRQQGKLLVKTLVKVTPPFRTLNDMEESFSEQRRIGELAVEKEIRRTFPAIDDLSMFRNPRFDKSLRKMRTAVVKENIDALSIILQDCHIEHVTPQDIVTDVSPAIHNKVRNKRGKIPINRRNFNWVIRGAKVRKFIREKKKQVGRLKGGWAAAARAFALNLPAWITRHASGGIVDRSLSETNPQIRITNTVSYAEAQNADSRFVGIALKNQTGKLQRQIDAKVRGDWEKSGAGK